MAADYAQMTLSRGLIGCDTQTLVPSSFLLWLRFWVSLCTLWSGSTHGSTPAALPALSRTRGICSVSLSRKLAIHTN